MITLGADPEVYIQDKKGTVVPAWEITKGLKRGEKERINDTVSVHADGVALEFNFNPVPATDFSSTAMQAYRDVTAWVNEKKLSVVCKATIGGWSAEALVHPLATETGCSEDFCAYFENPRKPRDPPVLAGSDIRHFGGHIHVGYDKELVPSYALVRMMDAFIYLPICHFDKQDYRRPFYGLPGLFRDKEYGVEYRTMSNFWLQARGVPSIIQRNMLELFNTLEEKIGEVHDFYKETDWNALQQLLSRPNLAQISHWWSEVGYPFCTKIDMEIETLIG